jgi:predicted aspartyl protease
VGERYLPIDALADAGATYTLAPSSILRRLGVTPHRKVPVILADGRRLEWELGRAWIRVNGQAEPTLVIFGDESQEPILGAYALEGLRLAVDPVNRRLVEVPGLILKANRSYPSLRRKVLTKIQAECAKENAAWGPADGRGRS